MMPAIPAPVVGGIRIPRHPLDKAARQLLGLARSLIHDAVENPPTDEETAKCVQARAASAKAATSIVLGLMAEQRERAKMAEKSTPMTDEEYAVEMGRQLKRHMDNLTDDEFVAFVDERMARAAQ